MLVMIPLTVSTSPLSAVIIGPSSGMAETKRPKIANRRLRTEIVNERIAKIAMRGR